MGSGDRARDGGECSIILAGYPRVPVPVKGIHNRRLDGRVDIRSRVGNEVWEVGGESVERISWESARRVAKLFVESAKSVRKSLSDVNMG